MNKLFTCFYGSRLYGTQTPTSDLDIKHIYLPDLSDLLLCKEVKNKVKKTNTEKNTKNGAEDVDEEFIPLQVFARDFFHGQTYALELAFSVEGTHAGQQIHDQRFVNFVIDLREQFLTSNIRSMMGYVVNQVSMYSFKGERLNAVNDVLKIFKEISLVDGEARLSDHAEDSRWSGLATKYPKYFQIATYDIGTGVMKPCFKLLEKTLPHTDSVDHAIMVVNALKNKYGARAEAASETNVDWKATMHAIRILHEGVLLLSERKLQFPFAPCVVDFFLKIKRGEVNIDEIKLQLNAQLDLLKVLEQNTLLPKHSPELNQKFEEFMSKALFDFYNIKPN